MGLDSINTKLVKGATIFKTNCASCHHPTQKLVGPPVVEMKQIYTGKNADLVKWIIKPGKKRSDYPQMPGFPQLGKEDLDELSKFILAEK
jgi:cytochrome c